MTRNLKTSGAVLMTTLALGLAGASVASASTFDHTFYAHGSQLTFSQDPSFEGGVQKFIIPGKATVSCTEVMASGSFAEPEKGTPEILVHPVYNKNENTCTNSAIGKTKVGTVGCDYLFTGQTDFAGHAELHFECEQEKEIRLESTGCTIRVLPQTATEAGIHFFHSGGEGTTEKALTVLITAGGIRYKSSAGCQLVGIPAEGTNMELSGALSGKAYKDEAHTEQAGLWTTEKETP